MARAKAAEIGVPSKTAEDLTRLYLDALRKLQASLQKQIETTTRSLASIPQEIQTTARKDGIEVINAYVEAVKGAIGQPDAAQRLEQALRSYVVGIQRIGEQAQRDTADSLQGFAATLRELPTDIREGLQSAYSQYTAGLKQALSEIDLQSIESEDLFSLAQSMLTVAIYTRAGLGK